MFRPQDPYLRDALQHLRQCGGAPDAFVFRLAAGFQQIDRELAEARAEREKRDGKKGKAA